MSRLLTVCLLMALAGPAFASDLQSDVGTFTRVGPPAPTNSPLATIWGVMVFIAPDDKAVSMICKADYDRLHPEKVWGLRNQPSTLTYEQLTAAIGP